MTARRTAARLCAIEKPKTAPLSAPFCQKRNGAVFFLEKSLKMGL